MPIDGMIKARALDPTLGIISTVVQSGLGNLGNGPVGVPHVAPVPSRMQMYHDGYSCVRAHARALVPSRDKSCAVSSDMARFPVSEPQQVESPVRLLGVPEALVQERCDDVGAWNACFSARGTLDTRRTAGGDEVQKGFVDRGSLHGRIGIGIGSKTIGRVS